MKKSLSPLIAVFLFSSTALLAMEERSSETSEHESSERISDQKRLRQNTEERAVSAAQTSYHGESIGSITCSLSTSGDEVDNTATADESHTIQDPSQPVQKRQRREEQAISLEERIATYDGTAIPSLRDLAAKAVMRLPAGDESFSRSLRGIPMLEIEYFEPHIKALESNIAYIKEHCSPAELRRVAYEGVNNLLSQIHKNKKVFLKAKKEKNYPEALRRTYLSEAKLPFFVEAIDAAISSAKAREKAKKVPESPQKRFFERRALYLAEYADALQSRVNSTITLRSQIVNDSPAPLIKKSELDASIAQKIATLSLEKKDDLNSVYQLFYSSKIRERGTPFVPAFVSADRFFGCLNFRKESNNRTPFGFFEDAITITDLAIKALKFKNKEVAVWYEKSAAALRQMAKISSDSSEELAPVRDLLLETNEEIAFLSFAIAKDYEKMTHLLQEREELVSGKPSYEPLAKLYEIPIESLTQAIDLKKNGIAAILQGKRALGAEFCTLATLFRLLTTRENYHITELKLQGLIPKIEELMPPQESLDKNEMQARAATLRAAMEDAGRIDNPRMPSLKWNFDKTFEENMTELGKQAAPFSSRAL